MRANEKIDETFSLKTAVGDIPNPDSFTFLLKIWVEEIEEGTGEIIWRGYVKNVIEKDAEHHFQDLDSLEKSLRPYLEKLGVKK